MPRNTISGSKRRDNECQLCYGAEDSLKCTEHLLTQAFFHVSCTEIWTKSAPGLNSPELGALPHAVDSVGIVDERYLLANILLMTMFDFDFGIS